jgi:hypothetical protein
MLLLSYSACLLIVHYGALLSRASGQAIRRPTTAWGGGLTPSPLPAGAPRTASSDRQGTKHRTPYSQGLRSASVPYRPTLADAALRNPNAPAPSCQPARLPTPPASPRFKVGQGSPTSQSLSSTGHRVPLRDIFPRHPTWACRAVGSARGDRLYPPDGRLALLRQWLRDPRRTRRRWF